MAEIGIHPVQAQRYRQMASLDEADVEEAAAAALERGSPLSKTDLLRRAKAKAWRDRQSPAIPPRPDHLNHFSLWLRNGARLVVQFAEHREAKALKAAAPGSGTPIKLAAARPRPAD